MSTTDDDGPTDAQTTTQTDAPDTHALASELGVDGVLLKRFVEEHHRPTAAIVIGWARTHGELRVHPEQLQPDVEAWLEEHERRARARRSDETLAVEDTGLAEHQILAMWGVETDE